MPETKPWLLERRSAGTEVEGADATL